MDRFLLSIYLRQIVEQAAFGVAAYQRAMAALNDATRRLTKDEWVGDGWKAHVLAGDEFWAQIQLLVNCSANVSKVLWGQKRKFEVERTDLRALVDVDNTSPLVETLMRNHYEHFDERIAVWFALPGMKLFADRNIGPRDQLVHSEPEPPRTEDFFRTYDPTAGDLSFWGVHFSVHGIAAELARVRDMANRGIADLDLHRE